MPVYARTLSELCLFEEENSLVRTKVREYRGREGERRAMHSHSRAAKFRRRSKKCARGAEPRPARHNFSQIYANSLVDVGQPVERLSPRLICRAASPIYASGACSKLAGVFTARRFTGTPGGENDPGTFVGQRTRRPACTHRCTPSTDRSLPARSTWR